MREGERRFAGACSAASAARFPIIDGIPVLIADDATRAAMHAMEAGRSDEALAATARSRRRGRPTGCARCSRSGTATYREALEVLSPDAEGTYFVYRFSDPTFVLAETLVRVLGRDRRRTGARDRPVRRLRPSDARARRRAAPRAGGRRRRLLLEAVAGAALHRARLRARVLRRQPPAAVRATARSRWSCCRTRFPTSGTSACWPAR